MSEFQSERSVWRQWVQAEQGGKVGPDAWPTQCAGAEQIDHRVKSVETLREFGYCGVTVDQPVTPVLLPISGPIRGQADHGRRSLVPEGENARGKLEREADAWLRTRDGDAQKLDLLREVIASDGVTSTWAKVIRADSVAHRGQARFVPVSHRYVTDKHGRRITVVVGRSRAFIGHVCQDWEESKVRRRSAAKSTRVQAVREAKGATSKVGRAVSPWSAHRNGLTRMLKRNPDAARTAAAIEAILVSSETIGQTVPIDAKHVVTYYGATCVTDPGGRSWTVREYAQRAALAGATID